jgi:A/G-specific adenine glycosylase
MLQQTQVATVIAYWQRWIEKWPTIADLATADVEVRRVVEGAVPTLRLTGPGSERDVARVRLLPPSAVVASRRQDSHGRQEVPRSVGRYTAGAICSMAYGIRTPIVIWLSLSVAQLILQIDGNVHRLFTRLLGIHASQVAPQTTKALWAAASDLIEGLPVDEARRGIAGDWNQVCPHTCKQSSTTLTPTGANGARKPSLQARWTRLCWMSATEKL